MSGQPTQYHDTSAAAAAAAVPSQTSEHFVHIGGADLQGESDGRGLSSASYKVQQQPQYQHQAPMYSQMTPMSTGASYGQAAQAPSSLEQQQQQQRQLLQQQQYQQQQQQQQQQYQQQQQSFQLVQQQQQQQQPQQAQAQAQAQHSQHSQPQQPHPQHPQHPAQLQQALLQGASSSDVPAEGHSGPNQPSRDEVLLRAEWRRVSFLTLGYVQAAWHVSKQNAVSLMMVTLIYFLAIVLPLVPVAVIAIIIGVKRRDHEHVNDDEWTTLAICIVSSVLLLLISVVRVLLPLAVGFPKAIFHTMRTGASLRLGDFFVRGMNWGIFKLLVVLTLFGGAFGAASWGLGTIWSALTMFAIPLYVDQEGRLGVIDSIKCSVLVLQRYIFSFFVLLFVGVVAAVLASFTVIGILLALPMFYIAVLFCHCHLIGVNGVALAPELIRPTSLVPVIDDGELTAAASSAVAPAFRRMPCFAQ